jgi:hypothetical protein
MSEKLASEDKTQSQSPTTEKFEESSSDDTQFVEDLEIGTVRSESASSAGTATTDDLDERPSLTHIKIHNSVPTLVMSHPQSGADLEKGPTGPQDRTVDEDGKIVVNWTSGNDTENPKNWPRRKKIFNVCVISAMTFLCPLCSAIFVCFYS